MLADSGRAHRLERLVHAAGAAREEELLLRPEEAEDVRLRDAGAPRDVLGGRAVQPALGELVRAASRIVFAALSAAMRVLMAMRRKFVTTHYAVKASC